MVEFFFSRSTNVGALHTFDDWLEKLPLELQQNVECKSYFKQQQ